MIFPIEVEFDRHYEDDSGVEQIKKVKKSLYPPMNAFAQKKVLTFNKFTGDFDFKVHYGDMEHLSKEVSWVGPTLLSNTHVSGVQEPLEKHKDLDSKGNLSIFRRIINFCQILNLSQIFIFFFK